jgi:hypothetical protein
MIILQMLRTTLRQANIRVLDPLIPLISDTFQPLIRPTLERQAAILGFPVEALQGPLQPRSRHYQYEAPSNIIDAEVFTDGDSLIVLTVKETSKGRVIATAEGLEVEPNEGTYFYLHLYYIGPELNSSGLRILQDAINKAFDVNLEPFYYRSTRFDEMKKEGRISPQFPSDEEVAGVNVLQDRAVRTLAIAIKASGGLLIRDLAKQLSTDERNRTEEIEKILRSVRLIESEIVVVCSKTQAQIARVPTREVLAQLSAQGVKCACGRYIADERVEEALTITELGRTLLDGSRWLTLLLLQELVAVGIPLDKTLVEQQVGGDELDLLVNISGELVFFELKDKEFSLGNAYSFGAKMGIIRPEYPVIVSTEYVGNDAKDHFQRANLARGGRPRGFVAPEEKATEVLYIEGLANLHDGLVALASEIYLNDAERILNEILPLVSLDSRLLLRAIGTRLVPSPESKKDLQPAGATTI